MSSAISFILKASKIYTATETRISQDPLTTLSPTLIFFPITIPGKPGYLAGECDETKLKGVPMTVIVYITLHGCLPFGESMNE